MLSLFKVNSIRDDYALDKVIGEGSFAVVRRALNKHTGDEFAIKIIDKTTL